MILLNEHMHYKLADEHMNEGYRRLKCSDQMWAGLTKGGDGAIEGRKECRSVTREELLDAIFRNDCTYYKTILSV